MQVTDDKYTYALKGLAEELRVRGYTSYLSPPPNYPSDRALFIQAGGLRMFITVNVFEGVFLWYGDGPHDWRSSPTRDPRAAAQALVEYIKGASGP